MSNSFDFEQFKAQAIEQLKAGAPLSGKDGVLAPLLENLLNSALEGEMDSHLEGGEREGCELLPKNRLTTLQALEQTLNKIFLLNNGAKVIADYSNEEEESTGMVAEKT